MRLQLGTWRIEPGQYVVVELAVTGRDGGTAEERTGAAWAENRGSNSYWTASLGWRTAARTGTSTFRSGHAGCAAGTALCCGQEFAFEIGEPP